ncbi:hypothetical protein B5M09_012603 [Aphanomyces astaci]|uniref:Uncharacterized protein n=1 Tax=Aphanomyces astaci TaxID=112090 RepID=A0A3R7YKA7_APHAT|nr:hypothetical protein B5M09_012603 [Aphanomyces astaci]
MDITGIRDKFDAAQFYRKLTQLGVDVIYHSHHGRAEKGQKGRNATQSRENTVTPESKIADTVPSPRPFQFSLQQSVRPEEPSNSLAPSEHVSVFEDDGEVVMDADDDFTDTHIIRLGFTQLHHHRGEIKAGTASGSTEPLTPTQILVEDALSLFELWLSIMAPTFFKRDAWVLCLTGKPVIWLTTGTGRLLISNTLMLILRSALRNSVLQRLVRHLPDHALLQQLTVMSEWTHVYGEDQTLSVRQEGTDRVQRLIELGLLGLASRG